MPRACTVCAHADRDAIDEALVGGSPYLHVANDFGVDRHAVGRHAKNHLPIILATVSAKLEERRAETLVDRIEGLYDRADRILTAAEGANQLHLSLGALRELRGIVELLGRATGELRDSPQTVVNIIGSSEWQAIRAAVFEALQEHPQARAVVAGRLLAIEPPS